jgi:ABC-type bacteriocin/lantibiotic exporter with double-glycine peptidase domain
MVENTPTPPSGAGGATQPAQGSAVSVERLTFSYPLASEPTVRGLSLDLPPGSRCLLIGANGAGVWQLIGWERSSARPG